MTFLTIEMDVHVIIFSFSAAMAHAKFISDAPRSIFNGMDQVFFFEKSQGTGNIGFINRPDGFLQFPEGQRMIILGSQCFCDDNAVGSRPYAMSL